MTFADERDFKKSRPIFTLRDKTVVRTWKNPLGVEHIFLADNNGKIIYGGFVGWIHSDGLKKAININKSEKIILDVLRSHPHSPNSLLHAEGSRGTGVLE
jgi:hypothetical protein